VLHEKLHGTGKSKIKEERKTLNITQTYNHVKYGGFNLWFLNADNPQIYRISLHKQVTSPPTQKKKNQRVTMI